MTASKLDGVNYSVGKARLTMFDVIAVNHGRGWYVRQCCDDIIRLYDVMATMTRLFAAVKAKDQIREVWLSPIAAISFLIEGVLTGEHFSLDVTEGVGFIDLPNVKIGEYSVTVSILKDADQDMCVTDEAGNIL
jgi:hypothetical protein